MTTNVPIAPRPIRGHADAVSVIRSIRGPSPLEPAAGLCEDLPVVLKREDSGPNGSFKWRGALCALTDFAFNGATAVVTASTGNHGAATAWAAARLGIDAHVVVPTAASGLKCSLIEANGAVLHRNGTDLDAAAGHARSLAEQLGAPYFEDGASTAQLLGTATIGAEIAEIDPGIVITPLAVGALAGGVGIGLARRGSGAKLFGVQVEGYDAIARLLRGDPPPDRGTATFADGLADNRIVEPAFGACRDHLSGVVVVGEPQLEAAVRDLHRERGIIAEGAGAAALAGLRELDPAHERGPIVLIVSGRNLDGRVAERLLSAGTGGVA